MSYRVHFYEHVPPEVRARVKLLTGQLAVQAARRLGRRPRVVDIGAQVRGNETHVYHPLKHFTPIEVIGFDPLEEKIRERFAAERDEQPTLLPYAIGDGGEHTLHVNDDDATSSLFPLDHAHNKPFNHLGELRTVRTERVATRRLDDVLPPGPVDFLKLDIQGAELMALQSGPDTLARTAAIHCEVEFSPTYQGQPLYPEVQQHLNAAGFDLIDLLVPVRYLYMGEPEICTQDRLLWADAVFFRRTDEPETLTVQSLIAAAVYRKPSLARYLLDLARGAKPGAEPAETAV